MIFHVTVSNDLSQHDTALVEKNDGTVFYKLSLSMWSDQFSKQNPKRKGNILNEQTRHRPLTIVTIIVPWIEKFQNKTDSAFTPNSYANSPN